GGSSRREPARPPGCQGPAAGPPIGAAHPGRGIRQKGGPAGAAYTPEAPPASRPAPRAPPRRSAAAAPPTLALKRICCGRLGFGPPRRLEVRCQLEPDARRLVVSRDHHEIVVLIRDREAEKLAVEPGERCRVRTVDDHVVKASDHGAHPCTGGPG